MTKTIKVENLLNICSVPSAAMMQTYIEGVSICLDYHNHRQSTLLLIEEDLEEQLTLRWDTVSTDVLASYDLHDATERGAVCLAIWIIEQFTQLQVAQRAMIGTGVDFFLCEKSDQKKKVVATLEVSGLLSEKKWRVNRRLKEKKAQSAKAKILGYDGYVIVIEFSKPIAKIAIQ